MKKFVFIVTVFCAFFIQDIFAQQPETKNAQEKTQTKLIDVSPRNDNSEMRSLRIDILIAEMQKSISKAAIIVYCGQICGYGEVEAHIRGINKKLRFRGIKPEENLIINGGYKKEQITEYWIISDNFCPPIKSEIPIEKVRFYRNFKQKTIYYDCCDF